MIKTIVKVRGSTNGIRNKYSINFFYYSTRNHTQRRFQSNDLSLIVHYKFLT
jgi:light-regulated signal transduction histidine kinase (bacteriophytochrome)